MKQIIDNYGFTGLMLLIVLLTVGAIAGKMIDHNRSTITTNVYPPRCAANSCDKWIFEIRERGCIKEWHYFDDEKSLLDFQNNFQTQTQTI